MLSILYIKEKKKIIPIYKNLLIYPVLLHINRGLFLYTYLKYIEVNKTMLVQAGLIYKESYEIYKKKNNIFNLISTYLPKLYLKDNLTYKTMLIKHNFLDVNYLFTKNILLPTNIISQLIHRQIINNYTVFLANNYLIKNNSLKLYSLYKDYIYITTYYVY